MSDEQKTDFPKNDFPPGFWEWAQQKYKVNEDYKDLVLKRLEDAAIQQAKKDEIHNIVTTIPGLKEEHKFLITMDDALEIIMIGLEDKDVNVTAKDHLTTQNIISDNEQANGEMEVIRIIVSEVFKRGVTKFGSEEKFVRNIDP